MNNSLMDRLMEAKHEYDIANVGFFNDGVVRKDENYSAKRINKIDNQQQLKAIEDVFYDATKCYSRIYDFDNIDMNLLVGLLFDAKDIDEDFHVREDANPIRNIVRYYTGSISSHLDGEKTNVVDYERIGVGRQGYVDFNQLVSLIKKSGLEYNGPENFDDFEKRILMGEPFEIVLSANFKEKNKTNDEFVAKTR